ncbi:MAG: hypothetical protein B7Y81_08080 [Caulobacter sp. 32-67-35]|nr:MAG: hypothetical protein B7Y81_08080 [Caulobacter sp. 32-67-35]OZA74294.1 MAG: hypothetical protein B7X77_08715 [Caulobacter sp. 39-67-4]HQR89480.1 hypothetical protein [Caulobacter sp.]
MNRTRIALFAAAATLTFAGAAFAQTALTPGQQIPMTASPMATPTAPMTTPVPPAEATTTTSSPVTATTTPPAAPNADTGAAPASAVVASDFKVGSEVRDPAGVTIGTISGTSAAADGSVNVVIANGATKFALPSASLSSKAGVLATTATKAQIDATLAAAKPQ